jgi:hypothetical protein
MEQSQKGREVGFVELSCRVSGCLGELRLGGTHNLPHIDGFEVLKPRHHIILLDLDTTFGFLVGLDVEVGLKSVNANTCDASSIGASKDVHHILSSDIMFVPITGL